MIINNNLPLKKLLYARAMKVITPFKAKNTTIRINVDMMVFSIFINSNIESISDDMLNPELGSDEIELLDVISEKIGINIIQYFQKCLQK